MDIYDSLLLPQARWGQHGLEDCHFPLCGDGSPSTSRFLKNKSGSSCRGLYQKSKPECLSLPKLCKCTGVKRDKRWRNRKCDCQQSNEMKPTWREGRGQIHQLKTFSPIWNWFMQFPTTPGRRKTSNFWHWMLLCSYVETEGSNKTWEQTSRD